MHIGLQHEWKLCYFGCIDIIKPLHVYKSSDHTVKVWPLLTSWHKLLHYAWTAHIDLGSQGGDEIKLFSNPMVS